jgi:hypothetical protein
MVVKRFTYEDGMNVLVPAKCGTRWMDANTNPKSIWDEIEHTKIMTKTNLVNSKTKMIFRNPHDALISGLHTEYVWFGYTIKELIDNFWENKFNHCSFDFWEHIYELWDIQPFELIPQSDLSELFNIKKSQLNRSLYDSSEMKSYITKEELKEKIGIKELKKMLDVINVDALWLERMIKNERGLVSQRILSKHKKTISDLELRILNIEISNKINSDKMEKSIHFNNIQIDNLNSKINNNKAEILKSIKLLNNIIQEPSKFL